MVQIASDAETTIQILTLVHGETLTVQDGVIETMKEPTRAASATVVKDIQEPNSTNLGAVETKWSKLKETVLHGGEVNEIENSTETMQSLNGLILSTRRNRLKRIHTRIFESGWR